jgi:hypothetical protein
MRFISSVLVAATALASFVAAQSTVIQFTKVPTAVVAGTPYTLEWKTTDKTTVRFPALVSRTLRIADSFTARHHHPPGRRFERPHNH